jgi:hypothetical protein
VVKQSDALEDVHAAIGPIARATLRKVVGHRRARPLPRPRASRCHPAPPSARDGRLAPVTAANGTSDGG